MDTMAFEASAKAEGFVDIEKRDGAANFTAKPHTHPFDVRALVLDGEFTLHRDGGAQTYRAGESFAMDAECVHAEQYGASGSTYILARRHHAAKRTDSTS